MGEIGEGSMWDGKWSYNRDKLQFAIVESQSWMSKKVKQQNQLFIQKQICKKTEETKVVGSEI